MSRSATIELSAYKPSLIDKTFLVGRKIKAAYKLGKHAALFVCERKQPHLILKCSSGNSTVFHRIEPEDIALYQAALERAESEL